MTLRRRLGLIVVFIGHLMAYELPQRIPHMHHKRRSRLPHHRTHERKKSPWPAT